MRPRLLLIAVLWFVSAPVGFAAYAELEEPALTMAKDYPEADYEKVKAVLNRKGCKYLGGGWLNQATSLRYGGDTTALNLFIEALSLCPNVSVHVNFYKRGNGVECDWMVTQFGASNEVVVRVNMESERIDMEKLYLPAVKADKPSQDLIDSDRK